MVPYELSTVLLPMLELVAGEIFSCFSNKNSVFYNLIVVIISLKQCVFKYPALRSLQLFPQC